MPSAPRRHPGSYPVKPAACHPFIKEGEVCYAASSNNAPPSGARVSRPQGGAARPRAVCGAIHGCEDAPRHLPQLTVLSRQRRAARYSARMNEYAPEPAV